MEDLLNLKVSRRFFKLFFVLGKVDFFSVILRTSSARNAAAAAKSSEIIERTNYEEREEEPFGGEYQLRGDKTLII